MQPTDHCYRTADLLTAGRRLPSFRRFSPSGSVNLSIDRSAGGQELPDQLPIIVLDLCDPLTGLLLPKVLLAQPVRVRKI